MSNTPRTDAACVDNNQQPYTRDDLLKNRLGEITGMGGGAEYVNAHVSRLLEHELTTCQKEFADYKDRIRILNEDEESARLERQPERALTTCQTDLTEAKGWLKHYEKGESEGWKALKAENAALKEQLAAAQARIADFVKLADAEGWVFNTAPELSALHAHTNAKVIEVLEGLASEFQARTAADRDCTYPEDIIRALIEKHR